MIGNNLGNVSKSFGVMLNRIWVMIQFLEIICDKGRAHFVIFELEILKKSFLDFWINDQCFLFLSKIKKNVG